MKKDCVLLIGMCYYSDWVASDDTFPKDLQLSMRRNRIRCKALQSLGYNVFTIDRCYPTEAVKARHIHFRPDYDEHLADRIVRIFKGRCFQHIILDDWLDPSWAQKSFLVDFLIETLPRLRRKLSLAKSGKIWLPNTDYVKGILKIADNKLKSNHFIWEEISESLENPLYKATLSVQKDLDDLFSNIFPSQVDDNDATNPKTDRFFAIHYDKRYLSITTFLFQLGFYRYSGF